MTVKKNISFEGMPGAGKTSSFAYLATHLSKNWICLPEMNPTPTQIYCRRKSDLVYNYLWDKRLSTLTSYNKTFSILYDRSFFTNLAYFYSTNITIYNYTKDFFLKNKYLDYFDKIFVFITSPEKGLSRRFSNADNPSFPWNNKHFLLKMQHFYVNELPTITKSPIIYINTEKLDINSLLQYINSLFIKEGCILKKKILTSDVLSKIFHRASLKYNLGEPYTDIINANNIPIIYYRQHALLKMNLNNKKVSFFDNTSLKKILVSNFCT